MWNLPAVLTGLGGWSAVVSSEIVAHLPILKLDMSPQQKQINPSWTHSRKNSPRLHVTKFAGLGLETPKNSRSQSVLRLCLSLERCSAFTLQCTLGASLTGRWLKAA